MNGIKLDILKALYIIFPKNYTFLENIWVYAIPLVDLIMGENTWNVRFTERIDKLKQIMPWYVLEYYQSSLLCPTV